MTRLRRLLDRATGAAVAARLVAGGVVAPRAGKIGVERRLAALSGPMPVRRPVLIHWSPEQIPFIEAESDDDLAVALGAVHAHLRLTQMELMRRVATGRLSEVVGPLGLELDKSLRLFDFARAAPAMIAAMSTATRRWAAGFVRGVNHQIEQAPPPPEFALLGMRREAWTLTDLLAVARLAAADVNWIVWSRLLGARRRMAPETWAALWPLLIRGGAREAGLGSNAAAVSGRRSRSGGAMLAADPHLSVALPNIWLVAGFRSPGLHAVGLMPAGLPVMAIGRNPWLAWGGTSLHAASSDLFDVTGLKLGERVETVKVRDGRPRKMVLRESAFGPVVSDGMLLRSATPLALRWVGHDASDEIGALLGVMRARGAESFRAALAGFAVPAQNMVHAGRDGRIGHLLAGRLPRRGREPPADLALPPSQGAAWESFAGTMDLPARHDPAEGFLASANEAPPAGDVPVGTFFAPRDRIDRMGVLLGGEAMLDGDALAAMMRDVALPGALRIRDRLIAGLAPPDAARRAAAAWAEWDGRYDGASRGAVAHEVVMTDLCVRLVQRRRRLALSAVWMSRDLLAEEILATPAARLAPALRAAIRRADQALARWKRWDGMHRLRLRHHLAAIPLFGRRFHFGEFPAEGGNDTLNNASHAPSRGRHVVQYGASARFVADLGEPDANRVVLLGGQDGFLGSENFLDQVPLWQSGKMLNLPLQPETARRWPHHTVHPPLEES